MLKNWENNGTEEIALVTPTPDIDSDTQANEILTNRDSQITPNHQQRATTRSGFIWTSQIFVVIF